MTDDEFDRAIVASGFALAADLGWDRVSAVAAARASSLPLDRARGRFLGRHAILFRFGRIADQDALAAMENATGSNRDRLFDLLMRRFDALQAHRGGVLALRTYLPRRPNLVMALGLATMASMAWMLEGAGISAQGVRGRLRVKGLTAAWGYAVRAWERDESDDLSATMAAVDRALDRAVRLETWLGWAPRPPAAEDETDLEPPLPPAGPDSAPPGPDDPPGPVSPPGSVSPPVMPGHEPPLPPSATPLSELPDTSP